MAIHLRSRWHPVLLVGVIVFVPLLARAAHLRDIVDPDRLAKHLKADQTQRPALVRQVAELRRIIRDYQWERGKQTSEAALWQGQFPDVQQMRDLRKSAMQEAEGVLDSVRAGLSPEQARRLEKLLKGEEAILDLPVAPHPFEYINNTPLFRRFQSEADAYSVTLPGPPSPQDSWTYADLLRTWTVRNYIPAQRLVDEMAQDQAGAMDQPELQTRVLQGAPRERAVKSPLLLAATLLVPDLGRSEAELLWDHYDHGAGEKEVFLARYQAQNRLEDAILVRLKMSTPYAEAFLDLDRWIVYLEDTEGIGHEAVHVEEQGTRPIESVEISLPGRQVEVTDVFGTYYPYIPGNKEVYYLEAPSKIVYTGYEKLVRLFFPGKDFQGRPIVGRGTRFLKLIVQSEEADFARTELTWELKRDKPRKPPRG